VTDSECNWRDHKDIERWAKEWREEPSHRYLEFRGHVDPIDELKHRVSRGDFAGSNLRSVQAYLDAHEARDFKVSAQGKAHREERMAAATERASRWAGWALFVSIAAFALSAWPYLRGWLD